MNWGKLNTANFAISKGCKRRTAGKINWLN